jgi:Flp pilus assembly pilin Flp
MKIRLKKLVRLVNGRSGQSLVEYLFILVLIAMVTILILKGRGNKLRNTLSNVNSNMP